MTHKLIIYIIGVLALLVSCSVSEPSPLSGSDGAGFTRLDSLISVQPNIVAQYEQKVSALKRQLSVEQNLARRYETLAQLSEAYASFQNDSARAYVRQACYLAEELGDVTLQNQSRLQKVHILSGAGLLETALCEIEGIDPATLTPEQQGMYYRLLIEYYIYQAEYNQHTEYEKDYVAPSHCLTSGSPRKDSSHRRCLSPHQGRGAERPKYARRCH